MTAPSPIKVAALALPLILVIHAPIRAAQPGDPTAVARLKRTQLVMRANELRQARAARWAGRAPSGPRIEAGDELASGAADYGVPASGRPFTTAALGTNVRANNRATDVVTCPGPVPCSTQSEEGIAAWHQYVLVAWNDAEHSTDAPPNNDVQGYGFSTNGGASFTDGGVPPKGTNWTWVSDPVVTVNEKTGQFYYCALADSTSNFSGLGIVPATFSGSSLVWGTPVMVRKVTASSLLLDKPWAVADSSTGNVYVSYTIFTAFGYDHIQFQRSANGVAWSPAVTLSTPADSGYVQGSRPAVGPNGEVYMVWAAAGPVDVDYFRIRKSTNGGVSFASQVTFPSGGNSSAWLLRQLGNGRARVQPRARRHLSLDRCGPQRQRQPRARLRGVERVHQLLR